MMVMWIVHVAASVFARIAAWSGALSLRRVLLRCQD